jgi:hypothetical protein
VTALLALALLLRAAPHDDLDHPTETGITLVPGLWHDDELSVRSGWHRYHFVADADGPVAFEMRAEPGDPTMWSYLRIEDRAEAARVWAGVADLATNVCEVIVDAERGHRYDVIATSQLDAALPAGAPQSARGPYTIAVVAP